MCLNLINNFPDKNVFRLMGEGNSGSGMKIALSYPNSG